MATKQNKSTYKRSVVCNFKRLHHVKCLGAMLRQSETRSRDEDFTSTAERMRIIRALWRKHLQSFWRSPSAVVALIGSGSGCGSIRLMSGTCRRGTGSQVPVGFSGRCWDVFILKEEVCDCCADWDSTRMN